MANSGIQGKFFSGLFWVLLLNLLVKPLWIFGIEVGVQNAVGAASYGFYFSIFNLAVIFNILLDLGITNYNTRNIARHPQLLGKHLSHILSIKVLLLFVYVVATFTIGALLGYDSHQFYILAFLCFNQFLNSLLLYLRSNYEGLLLFKWDSVLSVMDRVLIIEIVVLLVYTVADMIVFWHTGSEPTTLTACIFAAAGLENGVLGWIKTNKDKVQREKGQDEDQKDSGADG